MLLEGTILYKVKQMLTAGIATAITTTADLSAAGGFRSLLSFVRDNLAASLTDSRLAIGATGNPQLDVVMPRAGSVMGLSCALTVAPAGSNPVLEVYKNGALLDAACILTITAGADLDQYTTFAKDTYTFVAGDRIGLAVTTDGSWTATTSDLSAAIEVEF